MNNSDLNSTIFPFNETIITNENIVLNLHIEIGVAFITIIGLSANSIALYILSSSSRIRESRPYILLINQCLLDLVVNLMTVLSMFTRYLMKKKNMSGSVEWAICNFLHSYALLAFTTLSSSLNLSALSLERMFCVVFPIFHRLKITDRVMKIVATFVWIIGAFVILSLSIPSNQISPDGKCYFWDGVSTEWQLIFPIINNVMISVLPFFIMVVAFIAMYVRILVLGLKVRMNVIRMLGTCVILFFMCHFLKTLFSGLSRFIPDGKNWYLDPIYILSLLLVQINSLVNPFVYLIQYTEYRIELMHQIRRLIGKKKTAIVEP